MTNVDKRIQLFGCIVVVRLKEGFKRNYLKSRRKICWMTTNNTELKSTTLNLNFMELNWDFIDASRRKSLCFFRAKLRIRQPEVENAITSKRLKVETWNSELRWGTYESFFAQSLGAIDHVKRVSYPKPEMPIGGLHRSTSKTNWSRIKVSNLEAPGSAVSASKFKLWRFRHFLLIYYTFVLKTKTSIPPKLESWNWEIW